MEYKIILNKIHALINCYQKLYETVETDDLWNNLFKF